MTARKHRTASLALVVPAVILSYGCAQPSGQQPIEQEMVLIPGGEFTMGKDGQDDDCPAHRVQLDPFYIDKYEVTNAQYMRFMRETEARVPEFWGMDEFRSGPDWPNHPVVGISWKEATQYAAWAGKRLPTEAEWECAARGGLADVDFPNGPTLTPEGANYWLWPKLQSSGKGLLAVGSYPPNGYGLHDMAGNVGEWVLDVYDPDYYRTGPTKSPTGPKKGKFRVIRGGGWHSGPTCTRVHFRNALRGVWRDFNLGFRCVRDVPDAASQEEALSSHVASQEGSASHPAGRRDNVP
ncbi:MAG: formylglycine-generating enzyme family protein [Phycisphaerales bacterium]|nr:MAG: formylglycine-generating enzyme family protein [Phycisphaerales bacterium]